jgi:MFS family permease
LGRLPYLLLGLWAGVVVDLLDRKRLMVLCDAGRAIAWGSVALTVWGGHLFMAQLYIVAVAEGALFTFFNTAEAAALPCIVATDQLATAFAEREGVWSAANVVGPPLGGALFALGRALPFAADAVSYAVSALALLGMRDRLQVERAKDTPAGPRAIREALAGLQRQPRVRYLILLSAGFELALSGTELALIVQSRQQHATPSLIGLMLALGAAGTTAGYVVAPRIAQRFTLRAAIVTPLWFMTALWWMYAVSPHPLFTGLLMAGAGGAASVYIVVDVAYRVTLVPDYLQGRLNSIFGLLTFGVQSLSLALGGALVQLLGAPATLLMFAACPLVMALSASSTGRLRESGLQEKSVEQGSGSGLG